jgi:phosphohistidine phosphatase SixA
MLPFLAPLTVAAQLAVTLPEPPAFRVDSATELRREPLMAALKQGGYTILLRHARTDRSFKEEIAAVPAERSAQRNLTADGVKDAKLMGIVLRKYGIPIGEIVSSPMFRTRETAEFAAGTPTTLTMALRTFPTTEETATLVAASAKPGTNRLLVTHHFVIEQLVPGIRPGDVDESEAAVVRPTGDGKVVLVGRITLADWVELAGDAPTPRDEATPPAYAARSNPHHQGETNPAPVAVQPTGGAAELARGYISAFNSGDPARMRAFIESSLVADPNRPLDERVKRYAQMFEDFGTLTIDSSLEETPAEVTVGVRSKRGNIRVSVTMSKAQAGRIESVKFAVTGGGHS